MNLIRKKKDDYGQEFERHLFDQYKLYVEMADRVSARRMLANSFFVGIHTILITAFSLLVKEKILPQTIAGISPFAGVILLCFVWWRVIYSYRKLNSGKFKVIISLEQMLPVAPYDEEWVALGEGKDRKKYLPLTHVENFVPMCFGILYSLLAVALYYNG